MKPDELRYEEAKALYHTMETEALRRLRVAFITDAAHATSSRTMNFCETRIYLIDRELAHRAGIPPDKDDAL